MRQELVSNYHDANPILIPQMYFERICYLLRYGFARRIINKLGWLRKCASTAVEIKSIPQQFI